MERYKILKDLVSFNTIQDNQNKEIIDYIEKYLVDLGFSTEYKGKYLIMSIGEKPEIGFLGHTDTVEYTKGWMSNPFEVTQVGNKLYGLGVCDMKGGIAAILEAVSEIEFSKLKYGMKLYFTYDEEIGFGGIYDIINSKEIFPNTMIFGEPTNNEIVSSSKGILEYKLSFKGVKAHSSNPDKGKSANLNAIKMLIELDEFYNKKIKNDREENGEVPYTTMNIGTINGGSGINSVSDNCEVGMDFRIVKKKHMEMIKQEVEMLAQKYQFKIDILNEIEPFMDKTDFVEKIQIANILTEASFVKGVTRIILGAGPVSAHEVNEYITEESYNKLVEQYKNLIMQICK